jgi:hypothetical protein
LDLLLSIADKANEEIGAGRAFLAKNWEPSPSSLAVGQ